jgi:hypothetical protein
MSDDSSSSRTRKARDVFWNSNQHQIAWPISN